MFYQLCYRRVVGIIIIVTIPIEFGIWNCVVHLDVRVLYYCPPPSAEFDLLTFSELWGERKKTNDRERKKKSSMLQVLATTQTQKKSNDDLQRCI